MVAGICPQVNKPAGLDSVPWTESHNNKRFTFQDYLPMVVPPPTRGWGALFFHDLGCQILPMRWCMEGTPCCGPRVCHRLDFRVAGPLVVATSLEAMRRLKQFFAQQEVEKEISECFNDFHRCAEILTLSWQRILKPKVHVWNVFAPESNIVYSVVPTTTNRPRKKFCDLVSFVFTDSGSQSRESFGSLGSPKMDKYQGKWSIARNQDLQKKNEQSEVDRVCQISCWSFRQRKPSL